MEIASRQSVEPLVVLWTEDDENDRMMIDVALSRAGRETRVIFVEDGQQAWLYLTGRPPYSNRVQYPFPHALVTDLKMPRCNGFELVEQVRSDPRFQKLPIFVFSASDLAADRRAAQKLGVDGYVTKPTGFGLWAASVIQLIEQAADSLHAA